MKKHPNCVTNSQFLWVPNIAPLTDSTMALGRYGNLSEATQAAGPAVERTGLRLPESP